MPLVRVTMIKGKSPDYIKKMSDSIYEALVEAFQMPENDMFQIIEQLEPGGLIYDRNYGVGKSRSEDFLFINIESDARRRDEKEAFIRSLSEKLAASPGIAPNDIFVRLSVNTVLDDWSFGDGVTAANGFPELRDAPAEKDVTVTVSLKLKPEEAEQFCNVMLPELQKQTRVFKGVKSARAVRQAEDPTRLLFIDVFASRKDADAYFEWRRATGALDLLATLLSEPPSVEIWPVNAGNVG